METPAAVMSPYEERRWRELQAHWEKRAIPRQFVPGKVRYAGEALSRTAGAAASKSGAAIARHTPQPVKDAAGSVAGALVPTAQGVVHLLELLNDFLVEMHDPETVLAIARKSGHDVETLQELQELDLEDLELLSRRMAPTWGGIGAAGGAAAGALALIPVPVVGSAAAISVDLLAMQAMSTAVAVRVCHSYGFDATDDRWHRMINRMVTRAYMKQSGKAGTVFKAERAFAAAQNRVKWSDKLREDHRILAAVESLMKRAANGGHVPVQQARMGLPFVSIVVGAGTNGHVLSDMARQARRYAATVVLADKYGLPLPDGLRDDLSADED